MVDYDFSPFSIIDKFFQDQDQFTELRNRTIRYGCVNAVFAPDEYYFSLALGLLDRKSTLSVGTTSSFSFFNCHSDASPIMFTSLDSMVQQQANVDGLLVSAYFTLKQAIYACRCLREKPGLENLITMRKVAELELDGKKLSEITSECAVVVRHISEEVDPIMVNVIKSDSGSISNGQTGYIHKKMRRTLLVSAAIHPDISPEEIRFRRTKVGKRKKEMEKYAKREWAGLA